MFISTIIKGGQIEAQAKTESFRPHFNTKQCKRYDALGITRKLIRTRQEVGHINDHNGYWVVENDIVLC
jgi:hypothetical protein